MAEKRQLGMDPIGIEEEPLSQKQKYSRVRPSFEFSSEGKAHTIISNFMLDVKNEIKLAFLNDADNQIPIDIVDGILSYTQHSKMVMIWHAMCYKLGPLSALMKSGCNSEKIESTEQIIGAKIGETNYELPSAMRISCMLCNSIRLNTMALPSKFWMTFLPECHLLPINEWRSIQDDEKYSELGL